MTTATAECLDDLSDARVVDREAIVIGFERHDASSCDLTLVLGTGRTVEVAAPINLIAPVALDVVLGAVLRVGLTASGRVRTIQIPAAYYRPGTGN